MKTILERESFSERLKSTLKTKHYSPNSPTELSREFNNRYAGDPITVHAARKWLHGEAIPTQEKIRVLAQWLGVSTEWLRFGSDQANPLKQFADLIVQDDELPQDWYYLDERHRQVAKEFIFILLKLQRTK